jgi:hypothetical protein
VELCGFEAPTPIQKFTLPAILQGYDVIGIAQTGTLSDTDGIQEMTDMASRLGQDSSLFDTHFEQIDGKSQETCGPSAQPGNLPGRGG